MLPAPNFDQLITSSSPVSSILAYCKFFLGDRNWLHSHRLLCGRSASDGNSLKLVSGACNLPHLEKVKTGGEDAYFICSEKQVVGVADGVGGWADYGIDAGEYARELMSQAMIAVQQEPQGGIDPARVMEKAHSLTKCKGSSTACILALTDSVSLLNNPTLHVLSCTACPLEASCLQTLSL